MNDACLTKNLPFGDFGRMTSAQPSKITSTKSVQVVSHSFSFMWLLLLCIPASNLLDHVVVVALYF